MVNGKLPAKQKDMIQEIWQALYGVPDTEDNGIYGDFKDAYQVMRNNSKRITKLEITLASLITLLVGAGVLDATNVIHFFGG